MPAEARPMARRTLLKSAVLVIAMGVAYSALPLRGDRWWIGAAAGVAAIIGIMPITVRRLHAVRQADKPVLAALEAVTLLVAMLVFGFAAVYYAIDFDQTQFNGLGTRLDAIYFTVVTLSTVGFGDITATGQAARAIVIANVLTNLIFLGVVVRVMARAAGAMR
jgi:voltage-gated potassium channel